MKRLKDVQRLDERDPNVRAFVRECEAVSGPVSIRLVGATSSDVAIQVSRLQRGFGGKIAMSEPRQSGRGAEWIAYGTILR